MDQGSTGEPCERWRPIPGHEGRYEASDQGNIRSLIPFRNLPIPRLLRPETHWDGYRLVCLCTNGLRKRRRVHQLVLEAWVGPAPVGTTLVRHLDGNKSNNVLENLRYGTASENARDSVEHGTHSQASKTHCPKGHEFTPDNTKTYLRNGRPYRHCRTCSSERTHRRVPKDPNDSLASTSSQSAASSRHRP